MILPGEGHLDIAGDSLGQIPRWEGLAPCLIFRRAGAHERDIDLVVPPPFALADAAAGLPFRVACGRPPRLPGKTHVWLLTRGAAAAPARATRRRLGGFGRSFGRHAGGFGCPACPRRGWGHGTADP